MPNNPGVSEVQDKNGVIADIEAKRFDGTRSFALQGDITASQTWNGDSASALTLNTSIGAKKVTTDKINDKAVGTGQLADGAVGLTQIDSNAMNGTVQDNDSNLATHAAVKTYVDSQISGQGTYLGKHTVAEINAMQTSDLHNGDRVMVSDSGTINLGPGGVGFDVVAGEDLILYKSGSTVQWDSMDGNFKTKQTAVSKTGSALKTITSLTQNANGEVDATFSDIQDGTTSQKGVVQLAGSIGATVASENNKAASEKAVRDAINALDAEVTSNDGTNVQVKVTEADGKISAVNVTTDNTENKTNKVTSFQSTPDNTHYPSEKLVKDSLDAKADKVASATSGNFAGLDSNGNLTDSGSKASDFATSAQGDKADSAIQGVKVNSTTLTPDANKVVTIPLATTSADGAMSAADKTKLDGIEAGAEANVQADWNQTNSSADDFIKNKPYYAVYNSTEALYKVCTGTIEAGGNGIAIMSRASNGAIYGEMFWRNTPKLFLKMAEGTYPSSQSVKLYVKVSESSVDVYVRCGNYARLKVAPLINNPKSAVNFDHFGETIDSLPEGATEITPVWVASSAGSSGTAPVKVDAYGALTPVPMDSTPTASSTNLVTSGGVKNALDSINSNVYPWFKVASGGTTKLFKVCDIVLPSTNNYNGTRYIFDFSGEFNSGYIPTASGTVEVRIKTNGNDASPYVYMKVTYNAGMYAANINATFKVYYKYDSEEKKFYVVLAILAGGSYYNGYRCRINSCHRQDGTSIDEQVTTVSSQTEYTPAEGFTEETTNVSVIGNVYYSRSAVGSAGVPVYVNANGAVAQCTVDSAPTASSTNLVTSGGVKSALDLKVNESDVQDTYSSTSEAPISGKGVAEALVTTGSGYVQVRGPASNTTTVFKFSVSSSYTTNGIAEVWCSSGAHYHLQFTVGANAETVSFDGTYAERSSYVSVSYKYDSTAKELTVAVNQLQYYSIISKKVVILKTNTGTADVAYEYVNGSADNTYTTFYCARRAFIKNNNSAVGSTSVPAYVKATGEINACTDDFVHDGDVKSTYSATGTDPVNGTAVAAALATLDVTDSAETHKFVTAVSETDGKVSITRTQPAIADVDGLQTALDGKEGSITWMTEQEARSIWANAKAAVAAS